MPLYTFILDFRGGTYISQFAGVTAANAAHVWPTELDFEGIAKLRKKHRKILLAGLDEEGFVRLTGTKNVWCNCFVIGKHLALLNAVQTDAK